MRIKVRSKGVLLFLPLPVSMIGFIVRRMPDRFFEELQRNMPEPYGQLVTKEYANMVLTDCLDVLKENRGLEVIRVEASDGTYVSVRL